MQLYLSTAQNCSYLPDRAASNVFVQPELPLSLQQYSLLVASGFRRSGDFVYRPHCEACQACIPCRLSVRDFVASRSQRRNLKQNSALTQHVISAHFQVSHYELYLDYQAQRHPGGSMASSSREEYLEFLTAAWADTQFLQFYADNQLVAVAVYDQLLNGLSAVYSFYSPNQTRRALGKYMVLKLIQHCADLGLDYLYLGYWIAESDKMSYKTDYRPLEVFQQNRWQPFTSDTKT